MSDDSCRICLILDRGKIHAILIGQASGIVRSGCQRMGVSGPQETESERKVVGNGGRIYFAHGFLELLAQ